MDYIAIPGNCMLFWCDCFHRRSVRSSFMKHIFITFHLVSGISSHVTECVLLIIKVNSRDIQVVHLRRIQALMYAHCAHYDVLQSHQCSHTVCTDTSITGGVHWLTTTYICQSNAARRYDIAIGWKMVWYFLWIFKLLPWFLVSLVVRVSKCLCMDINGWLLYLGFYGNTISVNLVIQCPSIC